MKTSTQIKHFKAGGVFPLVIYSENRMRQYRNDAHREDAPHFSNTDIDLFERKSPFGIQPEYDQK